MTNPGVCGSPVRRRKSERRRRKLTTATPCLPARWRVSGISFRPLDDRRGRPM